MYNHKNQFHKTTLHLIANTFKNGLYSIDLKMVLYKTSFSFSMVMTQTATKETYGTTSLGKLQTSGSTENPQASQNIETWAICFIKSQVHLRMLARPVQTNVKEKTDSQYIIIVNTLLIFQKKLANRFLY